MYRLYWVTSSTVDCRRKGRIEMAGTLVVGYGASGTRCVGFYAEKYSQPVLLIDNKAIDSGYRSEWSECLVIGEDSEPFEKQFGKFISGYSRILVVSSAGGDSAGTFHKHISECARQSDIPMISLCTIPFSFESERRSRALEILSGLPPTVKNIFVVDLQKTIRSDRNAEEFLDGTAVFICDMLGILAGLLETSPFFSLCTEPQYTLSVGEGITFSDSVLNAVQNPLFNIPVMKGKAVICSGSKPSPFEAEQSLSLVAARFGALPEITVHRGLGKKVLLFIPISYRYE